MPYTKKAGLVFIDVQGMSLLTYQELAEFMRKGPHVSVIRQVPVYSDVPGSKERVVSYAGCFSVSSAEAIEAWLVENGVRLTEVVEV